MLLVVVVWVGSPGDGRRGKKRGREDKREGGRGGEREVGAARALPGQRHRSDESVIIPGTLAGVSALIVKRIIVGPESVPGFGAANLYSRASALLLAQLKVYTDS